MEFELIEESQAPANLSGMSREAREKLALLNALQPGKVAKVTIPQGVTLRSFKASISRVAATHGKSVEVWDDEHHVYVRLTDHADA